MPKRGDQRQSDSKLYWSTIHKKGRKWEYWVTESDFRKLTIKLNALVIRWQKRNPDKVRVNSAKQRTKQKLSGRKRDRSSERKPECVARRRNYKRAYEKMRMGTDPIYRLKKIVRKRIRNYLKVSGLKKCHKTFDMIGCSPEELKRHIENKFTPGMCWERPLEFHIDHKTPLSKAKTQNDLLALCHYTNLQPLWAFDNQSKGSKTN